MCVCVCVIQDIHKYVYIYICICVCIMQDIYICIHIMNIYIYIYQDIIYRISCDDNCANDSPNNSKWATLSTVVCNSLSPPLPDAPNRLIH